MRGSTLRQGLYLGLLTEVAPEAKSDAIDTQPSPLQAMYYLAGVECVGFVGFVECMQKLFCSCCFLGHTPAAPPLKNLQQHPTHLTHPTQPTNHKGLRPASCGVDSGIRRTRRTRRSGSRAGPLTRMASVGFVGFVGCMGLLTAASSKSVYSRMKLAKV